MRESIIKKMVIVANIIKTYAWLSVVRKTVRESQRSPGCSRGSTTLQHLDDHSAMLAHSEADAVLRIAVAQAIVFRRREIQCLGCSNCEAHLHRFHHRSFGLPRCSRSCRRE